MAYPNFRNLQSIYNQQINLLLANTGLTTRCDFNFGVTNNNICPNCIYDVGLKKSSGKYKNGGPIPFNLGKICPYCNGIGSYGIAKTETGYLAIIWDYKKWINPPPQIDNPSGYIQTICHKDYLPQIRQCKDMTVIYTNNTGNPVFQLYGEPNPAGLGDNQYLFCMWKKIGVSNTVPVKLSEPSGGGGGSGGGSGSGSSGSGGGSGSGSGDSESGGSSGSESGGSGSGSESGGGSDGGGGSGSGGGSDGGSYSGSESGCEDCISEIIRAYLCGSGSGGSGGSGGSESGCEDCVSNIIRAYLCDGSESGCQDCVSELFITYFCTDNDCEECISEVFLINTCEIG